MLTAPVTGTWTAIEALVSDLWETALNCHPKTLAMLKGPANRINKSSKEHVSQQQQSGGGYDMESKSVPLYLIEMNEFDLRNSMGSVFRRQRRFEFSRLSGIREAYSRAFSAKSGSIDSSLGSTSLDCLSVVRNIIVHKAGIADAEYDRHSSYLKIPKAEVGKPVLLDGKIVADLIRPAISSTKSLSIAVNNWIAQN